MRLTIISCQVGVAGFNANRPIGDREGSWISHGAASVGASAEKAGHDVDLIDLRNLSGWGEFESVVKKSKSDVYGLSVSPVDHWSALRCVLIIKRNHQNARIIVGGIHPSVFPGEYDFDAIDTVVQGEGECAINHLLSRIESGISLPKIYQGPKPNLDTIPWADRELFDYKKELQCNFTPDQDHPSITMLAGRGCPYQCSYCQPAENAVFGHPYRMRSPENVVAEMLYLKGKYHYKSVTFWDDTFTFNTKWVQKFCELYEKSGINAPIVACSRADIICRNEIMIENLARIGVTWFVVGLESGSQRILDMIKKGTTVEQNINAAKICRKYGIKVFGTYMYGLPTETEDDVLATANMIDEINPDHGSPFWFVPIKGTGIYNLCEKEGLILEDAKKRTIERTGRFEPTIKGANYEYIKSVMMGNRDPYRRKAA